MRISLLIILCLLSCNRKTKVPPKDLANINCLFSKPLVIGASVSAGHGTQNGGPSTVLSKLLNPLAEIDNRAVDGATSLEILSGFSMEESPSIILGFDLFFWDAAKNECGEGFLNSTKKFFQTIQEKETPMIIGKIPVSVPFPAGIRLAGLRPCAKVINSLIDELCTPESNCLIYDPTDCIKAMGSSKDDDGKAYFSDKLHTSDVGNKFCAEHFVEVGKYKTLDCTI